MLAISFSSSIYRIDCAWSLHYKYTYTYAHTQRQLLDNFLCSASKVLHPRHGQIHVALCEGQGGADANNLQGWRQSWMASQYAAEHGLLLHDVQPFESLSYNRSSYRGGDKPFLVGQEPELYIFGFPHTDEGGGEGEDAAVTNVSIQLCCRHELHILLPPQDQDSELREDLMVGDAVLRTAQSIVPDGIRVEVPLRDTLQEDNGDLVGVYLLVYCGERRPITRDQADSYREAIEQEMDRTVGLRQNRRGRLVSKPFPYNALQQIMDDHACGLPSNRKKNKEKQPQNETNV